MPTTWIVAGAINVSGEIRAASAVADGGRVTLLARKNTLAPTAVVDASGAAAGGRIKIGGALTGGAALPAADLVDVATGARIVAEGGSGAGGTVILWSESATRMNGRIAVAGGDIKPGGSFVEISSRGALGIGASATVLTGAGGSWRLDPCNVIITTGRRTLSPPYDPDITIDPPNNPGDCNVNAASLVGALNNGSNVTVTTTQLGKADAGNLTVVAAMNWSGIGSLTLRAENDIFIDATLTTIAGNFTAVAARNIVVNAAVTSNGAGNLALDAGSDMTISANLTGAGTGGIDILVPTGNIGFTSQPQYRVVRTTSGPLIFRALLGTARDHPGAADGDRRRVGQAVRQPRPGRIRFHLVGIPPWRYPLQRNHRRADLRSKRGCRLFTHPARLARRQPQLQHPVHRHRF